MSPADAKDPIGDPLRRRLEMIVQPKQREPFRTRSLDLGRPRLLNIDNIGEVLAVAEGESWR